MRVVTAAIAKGGVGKTTQLFHLLRWYAVKFKATGEQVAAFDPDGSNKSLTYLSGGKLSPYKARFVNVNDRKELFAVTGALEHGQAKISVLDGVGSQQESLIDANWFDYIRVPNICGEIGARVTLVLIVDNTAAVYKQCLRAIRKYGQFPTVDFAILHVRRDHRETLEMPTKRQAFDLFINGDGELPGARALLPDFEKRFAYAVCPHLDTDMDSDMHMVRGTMLDLFNMRYIDDRAHLANYQRTWDDFYAAFDSISHLLLPVSAGVPQHQAALVA